MERPERPIATGAYLIRIALIFYPAMVALALGLQWMFDIPSLLSAPAGPPGPIPQWLGLVIGALFGLLLYAGGELARERLAWARRFYEALSELIGNLTLPQALGAAVLSGIGEEVLFRGALQPLLGVPVSALIFGLVHLAPDKRMRAWPVYAVIVGLALGYLYQASGTLWAPVLAHFTVNFLGLSALGRNDSETP